jgi:YfiH family protein
MSAGKFRGLNLAQHVGDEPAAVESNRRRLVSACRLPSTPIWMNQIHGTTIIDAGEIANTKLISADGAYAGEPNLVLAILSADCLPIVVCDDLGQELALIHAGWKGLFRGIVESAIGKFQAPPARLLAWIGPGISQHAYIVDDQFRQRFIDFDSQLKCSFFPDGAHWRADLYKIAEHLLNRCGVIQVSRYGGCTFNDVERFYSYRRDGSTGRMATIGWLSPSP